MRHGIDRWLWLAILMIPIAAWLFSDSRPAPTVLNPGDSVPAPVVDPPPGDVTRVPQVVEEQPDPVPIPEPPGPPSEPLKLRIRALTAAGELSEPGTVLPLVSESGPIRTAEAGFNEIDGDGLDWVVDTEHRIPLGLPGGQWVIDITFQEPSSSAPAQLEWVALARDEAETLPARLFLSGETELPPGLRMLIKVMYRDRVLEGGIELTDGNKVWWNRTLVSDSWFAGRLDLMLEWDSSQVSESMRKQIEKLWPPAARGEVWSWHGSMSVDDPAEARRQQRGIARWYLEALAEVEATRDLLLVAGAHARGKRASLLRDPQRTDQVYEHPLAPVLDKLGRGASFDFKRWRALIDEDLPRRWKKWAAEGQVPWPHKHPGAARNVALLFGSLRKYSRLESTILYEALGKPRHLNDFVANFDWGPATERKQTLPKLRNYIESIRASIWP
ncbi:MAG: hypothetical protein VX949_03715 [Planctomycetota bacterium]|nr:hypothetical protein [Planctomycetota bacterium]